MHKLLARTPLYLFILTLIIITIMFYASNTEYYSTLSHKPNKPPKSVNIFINDMELIISNEQGLHQANLISQKVNHDPKSAITFLQQPVLLINHENAAWKITSNKGQIIHNKHKLREIEKIVLSDNVVIIRENIQKNIQKNIQEDDGRKNDNLAFLDLKTSEITYLPKEELVVTDKKVTITSKESITTAQGLKFNKKTQKLDLLSNVKSIYTTKNDSSNKNNSKTNNNSHV